MKPILIHTSFSDSWHVCFGIATIEYETISFGGDKRLVADGLLFFNNSIRPFFSVECIYDKISAEYYVPVPKAALMMSDFENDSRGLWPHRADELRAIMETLGQ